jgi:hypothetical protein
LLLLVGEISQRVDHVAEDVERFVDVAPLPQSLALRL